MPDLPLLESVLQIPGVRPDVAATEVLPKRIARYDAPQRTLHPKLTERLAAMGIERLYSHQAHAFDAVMSQKDVMVVTGTNSGKTMCYALPALQHCLEEPACRVLMMYPTKALAQDQLGKLLQLSPDRMVRVGTYDGDTPQAERGPIRRLANIVLTNPDMLHVGILPGHENWSRFLRSLRLIVIDELHAYRGVFGCHVAGILKRLLRLCEWHGAHPQIVACSATIGNPIDLFGKMTGRVPTLLAEDGSPQGRKTVVFYNPPEDDTGRRQSANYASAGITANLVDSGLRVLAFCRSRVAAELVLRYTREVLERIGDTPPGKVESYRSGYTPDERRQIEQALFEGRILALACTNAMELGVDVGGLDAVVMNGYPGTIASFWQQAGRAGRGERDGVAILIAKDDPLEQFLMRNPRMLLDSSHEPVSINPENRTILEQQLLCAAYERAVAPSELETFGESALAIAEAMDQAGELEFRAGRFYYPKFDSPAPGVNVRGSGKDQVALLLDAQPIGTMEHWRALQWAHKGAVYLHRGVSYVVQELDLEQNVARLAKQSVPYFTQSMVHAAIEPTVVLATEDWGPFEARLCGLRVTEQVIGFRRKSLDAEREIDFEDLDLPAYTFETVGVRLILGPLPEENPQEAMRALHGLEHALMAVAPFLAGCDRGDFGSAWYGIYPDTPNATLFVYDHVPGGVGLCEDLFKIRDTWGLASLRLLDSCSCADGCPACLMSARCESGNEMLSKPGALGLLRALAAQDSN